MKHILFILLLVVAAKANAQSWDKASVEKRLCREWVVDHLVMNGEKEAREEGDREETMTFKADYTAISSDSEEPAKWSYDESKQSLLLTVPEEEMELLMKIVELTEEKLVLEMGLEGEVMQAHFSAIKK